jgi:hypothetical protein
MNQPSAQQFGLIVAYLIPGFVALAGLAPLIPAVAQWLQPVHDGVWGFGPPVYTLLAAITMSQILNCFRWVLLDQLHQWTGLKPASTNFGQLQNRIEGFDYLVQNHYRYYQFAGNMLLAVLWSYGVNRILRTSPSLGLGTDLGVVILVVVLFAASRDALSKYYHRTHSLLGEVAEKGGQAMYNGVGHHEGAGQANEKPSPEIKPQKKSAAAPKPSSEKDSKSPPSK